MFIQLLLKEGASLNKILAFLLIVYMGGCGFLNSNVDVFNSGNDTGDHGDGRVPSLSARIRSSDRLSDKTCEEVEACQRACQEVYDEIQSYRACYGKTVGQVADIQDLFRALVMENIEDQEEKLKKVDADALEEYLQAGINGFSSKAIIQIETYSPSQKQASYKNILVWISQSGDIIRVLNQEDQHNEILETLLSNYAKMITGALTCSAASTVPLPCSSNPSSICSCKSQKIYLDDSSQDRGVKYEMLGATPPVTIAPLEESKANLLKYLSVIDSEGWNFFLYSLEATTRYNAFVLVYDLVEKACSNDHTPLANQCIAGFLCWLEDRATSRSWPIDNSEIQGAIGNDDIMGLITGNKACQF